METLLKIPVVSFLIRYWKLLIAAALLVWFTRNGSAFESFGAMIYGPGQTFLALLVAMLSRHLFFAQSADTDAADGTFVKLWRALPDNQRVLYNVVILCVFFLGACIVFASVSK